MEFISMSRNKLNKEIDNVRYELTTVYIKYEDALFLYNTEDEDILRLFIISLINKIKNNDY